MPSNFVLITTSLILLLSVTSDVSARKCKRTEERKALLERLSSLSEDSEVDAVVTAHVLNRINNIYKFDLLETWPHYKGGMHVPTDYGSEHWFKVRVPERLLGCAPHYRRHGSWYLILKKVTGDEEADFELLEQMVSVHKTKIRREIYKRVCKDRGCPDIGKFGVAARNVVTREDFLDLHKCMIQTSFNDDEWSMEWLRNGEPVKADNETIRVLKGEGGIALVMKPRPEYEGEYTCRLTVKAKVSYMEELYRKEFDEVIKVHLMEENERNCLAWSIKELEEHRKHCNGNGECVEDRRSREKRCVCDRGYAGDRCDVDTLKDADWY